MAHARAGIPGRGSSAVLLLLCLALIPWGCGAGGADSIQDGAESWMSAMSEGDVDGALAWYERRGAFLPPGEAAVVGRGAVGDRWQGILERYDVHYDGEVETAEVTGGRLGYVYGSYSISGVDHATGERFAVEDTFVQVWRRQRDGSWLIAMDMWHPPAQEARGLPAME